jgi:hypothetical protein
VAQKTPLSYRVSANGPAGDWYWELISGRDIISRGLAPTKRQARAGALKAAAAAASHIERRWEVPTLPLEGLSLKLS